MKSLVLVFLFAATLCEASGRTFYAKVNGKLHRLNEVHSRDVDMLALGFNWFPVAPMFILKNGTAVDENNAARVLGRHNGLLVLGNEPEVTPLRLQIDENSQILNLEFNMCKCAWGKLQEPVILKETVSKYSDCLAVGIYFLSPAEAEGSEASHHVGMCKRDPSGICRREEKKPEEDGLVDFPLDADINILVLRDPPTSASPPSPPPIS